MSPILIARRPRERNLDGKVVKPSGNNSSSRSSSRSSSSNSGSSSSSSSRDSSSSNNSSSCNVVVGGSSTVSISAILERMLLRLPFGWRRVVVDLLV